jgi:hypothetical protein
LAAIAFRDLAPYRWGMLVLSQRVDEVFFGHTTLLSQRSLQRADIDQRLLFPGGQIQSLLTQDIRLRESTLEKEYHQDTYRLTTTASPDDVLAYYHATLTPAGWKYVCAPRSIDGLLPDHFAATCLVVAGPFPENWKAHALFDIPEQSTHLNIIIYPPNEAERIVEVIKITVYQMAAYDTFEP